MILQFWAPVEGCVRERPGPFLHSLYPTGDSRTAQPWWRNWLVCTAQMLLSSDTKSSSVIPGSMESAWAQNSKQPFTYAALVAAQNWGTRFVTGTWIFDISSKIYQKSRCLLLLCQFVYQNVSTYMRKILSSKPFSHFILSTRSFTIIVTWEHCA